MNALNIYKKNLYFNEHFMFTYFPNHFESNWTFNYFIVSIIFILIKR
jgi:hypothetical protein